MAEFEIQCPHCQSILEANADIIGESVQCPECQKNFTVRPNNIKPSVLLYSPTTVGALSIIFTPVFSAYCIYENYKSIEASEESSKSLYFLILNIAILIGNILFQFEYVAMSLKGKMTINGITDIIEILSLIFVFFWWQWNYMEISKHLQYLKEQKIICKPKSLQQPVMFAFCAIVITGLLFVLWGQYS